VTEVFVKEGQEVRGGEVLATLASAQLVAQRNAATAELRSRNATFDQLTAGESTPVRAIASTNLKNAEQNLARIISEEAQKVANARKTLLSSSLFALSNDENENATAPTISGSYTCEDEGTYTLEIYNSSAHSGYSYRYFGLEKGTSGVSTNQPSPLGECGLLLQFTDGDFYSGSTWTITIPNTFGPTYIAHANAYALALENQANAVAAAEDARVLAEQETAKTNAGPRSEEIRQMEADIDRAYAHIAEIDAQIKDRSIVAPFDGIITNVAVIAGESAQATPVITLLANNAFELKARIPEIDITKIETGQKTFTVFDARQQEELVGSIAYVSPLATLIDGVAYFEATILLETIPSWIRGGLNADINIIISTKEDVLRIPKRFLIMEKNGSHSVLVREGTKAATSAVALVATGNDGFVEVEGLREGQIIIAP